MAAGKKTNTREYMSISTIHLYRLVNSKSRAVDDTTWYGSSGVVRRATCIYCRRVVATSSGRYKETIRSFGARQAHVIECKKDWLNKLMDKVGKDYILAYHSILGMEANGPTNNTVLKTYKNTIRDRYKG